MKYIYSIIVALFIVTTVNAQTNTIGGITSNTNVQDVIVSILTGVKSAGGEIYDVSKSAIASSIDMVKSQAPELVTEFLKWKFTEASIWCVFGIILVVIGIYGTYKGIKMAGTDYELLQPPVIMFGGVVPLTIGIIMFASHIFDVVQIYVAPKIYLIEYIVNVVKHH